jgi:hypothetical protein
MKKHKAAIQAASSSTKASFFKQSFVDENELKWRPQEIQSHHSIQLGQSFWGSDCSSKQI